MVLIIFLEWKFPYRKNIPFFREGFWTDLIWYTLIQSYILKIIIFDYIISPLNHYFHLSFDLLNHIPLWGQAIFFLVIHDFYIYWFHRFQHSSKVLWRTHEAHHSNKEIDWIAGSRSHSIEIIINQTIEFLPIVLLGANPMVVPLKAWIDAVWGMYIHSNINVKSGKLQYIINGPEMHQWHHANDKNVYHANFSTKFAIWDWIFGTGYLPDHKPKNYGLNFTFPKDYFLQQLFAFRPFKKPEYKDFWFVNPLIDFRKGFIKPWNHTKRIFFDVNGFVKSLMKSFFIN